MNLQDIEHASDALRRNPGRTALGLLALLSVVCVSFFLSGYLGQKGEEAASNPDSSSATAPRDRQPSELKPGGGGGGGGPDGGGGGGGGG